MFFNFLGSKEVEKSRYLMGLVLFGLLGIHLFERHDLDPFHDFHTHLTMSKFIQNNYVKCNCRSLVYLVKYEGAHTH